MYPWLVDLVAVARKPPARVLDFGSGSGALGQVLREKGYVVTEYEPGRNTQLPANDENAEVSSGLAKAQLDKARYDLLCCFEVLEHILPEEWEHTFLLLRNSLKTEGIFIGSVPADERLEEDKCLCPECGAFFHRFQHQRAFSRESLENMLRAEGFKHINIIWIPFSYYFYASAYTPYPGDMPAKWAALRDKYNADSRNFAYYKDRTEELEQLIAGMPSGLPAFLVQHGKLPGLGRKILKLLSRAHEIKNRSSIYQKIWRQKERLRNAPWLARVKQGLKRRLDPLHHKLYWDESWIAFNAGPGPESDDWLNRMEDLAAQTAFTGPGADTDTHLVLVTGYLGPGGAERQWCYLACELAGRGYKVTLMTLGSVAGSGGHYLPLLKGSGVRLVVMGDLRVPSEADLVPTDSMPREAWLPAVALDQLRPSHVIAQLDDPNVWCAAAALVQSFPPERVLMSFRNRNPSNFWFNKPYYQRYYRILSKAPHVIFNANSQSSADDYARWIDIDAARIGVAHNALRLPELKTGTREEMRLALGIPLSAPLVLGVFRLSNEKNPALFLKVARAVHEKLPDAVFLHAGVGHQDGGMRGAAQAQETRSWFRLLGRREDVNELMRAADILLLTSDIEGLPNVLLEAQANELPVVATRVGGVADAVREGETAILTDKGDMTGLAQACLTLLGDAERRRRMGHAGRRFVETHFTAKTLGAAILWQLGLPLTAPLTPLAQESQDSATIPLAVRYRQLRFEELLQNCPQARIRPLVIFAHIPLSPETATLLPPGSLCLTLPGVKQPEGILSMELDWRNAKNQKQLIGRLPAGACALILGPWPHWEKTERRLHECGLRWLLTENGNRWYLFPLSGGKIRHELHGLCRMSKRKIGERMGGSLLSAGSRRRGKSGRGCA